MVSAPLSYLETVDTPTRNQERLPLARFKDAEPILAATERWKNRCLLGGRSVFTDRSLWTRSNFEELQSVYVENLDDLSKDSFQKKLERLLKPASPDAKCLWAEMTWVYRLIQASGSMGSSRKRATITAGLGMVRAGLPGRPRTDERRRARGGSRQPEHRLQYARVGRVPLLRGRDARLVFTGAE